MSLYVKLINPKEVIFEGVVDTIWLPGYVSPFQVLPNHAPLLSILEKGTIKLKINDEFKMFEIESGVVEVNDNKISVIID